uniref:Polymerase/primase n=1 Tax=Dulem virus 42 TaxID=3145760 RepID=A0AAU8B9L8_9CAUD
MKHSITPEEIELIKSAQAGSELAFSKLFKLYKPFVDNLLYSYLKDRDEARDITNIVFLRVHEKLSKFTNYSTFGGWLRILTKNVAIDYLRTVKNNCTLQDNVSRSILDEDCDDTEVSYTNKITYDSLIAMFDKLPPSYREACQLFYVENMTVAQISEALNMPKGTIKSSLHRMRKILKKLLTQKEHVKSSSTNTCGNCNICSSPIQQEQ